jgi:hypothetical protein
VPATPPKNAQMHHAWLTVIKQQDSKSSIDGPNPQGSFLKKKRGWDSTLLLMTSNAKASCTGQPPYQGLVLFAAGMGKPVIYDVVLVV